MHSKRRSNLLLRIIANMVAWLGAALGFLSGLAVVLGMVGIIPGLNDQILHQSGIRWLAEIAISGLLVAALGFYVRDVS